MADRAFTGQWLFRSVLTALICFGSSTNADVTIRSLDGKVSISGELVDHTSEFLMLRTTVGILKMVRSSVECEGAECPRPEKVTLLANARIGSRVRITALDNTMSITGELSSFKRQVFGLETGIGSLKIPASSAICEGNGCPVETLVDVSDIDPELLEILLQQEDASLVPATPSAKTQEAETQIALNSPVSEITIDTGASFSQPEIPDGGSNSQSILFSPSIDQPESSGIGTVALPGTAPQIGQSNLHISTSTQNGLRAPNSDPSASGFAVPQLDGTVKSTAFTAPAVGSDNEKSLLIAPPAPGVREVETPASEVASQNNLIQISAPAWVNRSILPALVGKYADAKGSSVSFEEQILTLSGSGPALSLQLNNSASLSSGPIRIQLGASSTQSREIVLGNAAHVAIVSPDNPIDHLSLDQLRNILSGRFANWAQLGERRANLKLMALASDTELAEQATTTFNTFADLDAAIATDPHAIALVPFRSDLRSRTLPIAESCGLLHTPTQALVQIGDYPVSQSVSMAIAANAAGAHETAFFEFVSNQIIKGELSDIGLASPRTQRWSLEERSERLKAQRAGIRDQAAASDYAQLLDLMNRSDALSSVFRFKGASLNLDDASRMQLSALITYLAQNDPVSELMLVGFSDNVGSYTANALKSQRRADAVAHQLAVVDIVGILADTKISTYAMSELNPVSCNQNSQGRARNRRVEIWVKK